MQLREQLAFVPHAAISINNHRQRGGGIQNEEQVGPTLATTDALSALNIDVWTYHPTQKTKASEDFKSHASSFFLGRGGEGGGEAVVLNFSALQLAAENPLFGCSFSRQFSSGRLISTPPTVCLFTFLRRPTAFDCISIANSATIHKRSQSEFSHIKLPIICKSQVQFVCSVM